MMKKHAKQRFMLIYTKQRFMLIYTMRWGRIPCALGSLGCVQWLCTSVHYTVSLHVLAAVPVRHHCIPLYQVKIPILKSLVPHSVCFHVSCHPYAVNYTIITVSYSMPPTHVFLSFFLPYPLFSLTTPRFPRASTSTLISYTTIQYCSCKYVTYHHYIFEQLNLCTN